MTARQQVTIEIDLREGNDDSGNFMHGGGEGGPGHPGGSAPGGGHRALGIQPSATKEEKGKVIGARREAVAAAKAAKSAKATDAGDASLTSWRDDSEGGRPFYRMSQGGGKFTGAESATIRQNRTTNKIELVTRTQDYEHEYRDLGLEKETVTPFPSVDGAARAGNRFFTDRVAHHQAMAREILSGKPTNDAAAAVLRSVKPITLAAKYAGQSSVTGREFPIGTQVRYLRGSDTRDTLIAPVSEL